MLLKQETSPIFFGHFFYLSVVSPHVLLNKQHTPNPWAQDPDAVPPSLEHSESLGRMKKIT